MAVERWVTGVTSGTWTSAFGVEAASLPNGSAVNSSVSITAGSSTAGYDMFADLALQSVNASIASTVAPYLGVYIFPLNADGTSYGDGTISTSTGGTAIIPKQQYYAGALSISTSSSSAAAGLPLGQIDRMVIPPRAFKFCIYNQTGATLPTSVTMSYQTYNRQVS
jgi:hypothetical protein